MLLRVGDEYYEYQIKKDVYLLVSINKLFCRGLFITGNINNFSINIKLDIIIIQHPYNFQINLFYGYSVSKYYSSLYTKI